MLEIVIPERITHALGRVPVNTGNGFLFERPCPISPQPMSLREVTIVAYKPRTRQIKPSYFTSEDLADQCYEARILYAGLWTIADRVGRLEDRPRQIKVHTLPYDDVDVDELLSRLAKGGLIIRYQVNGQALIEIPKFTLHQSVHPHEAQSLLPEPQGDSRMSLNVITSNDKSRQGLPLQEVEVEVEVEVGKEVVQEEEVEENDKVPYSEIISDLNEVLGTKYREKTEETRKAIRRWWKQGFRLEDFKVVHRTKANEWLNNPEFRKYLRPDTLYGKNFESYLNQGQIPTSGLDRMSEAGRKTYLAGLEALRERREKQEDH